MRTVMLLLGVVTFSIAIPLCSNTVNAFHYTRLAVITCIIGVLLAIGEIHIGVGEVSIYCSLVFQSDRTLFMDVLLYMVGGLCLITFHPGSGNKGGVNSFFTSTRCNVGDTFEGGGVGERGRYSSVV